MIMLVRQTYIGRNKLLGLVAAAIFDHITREQGAAGQRCALRPLLSPSAHDCVGPQSVHRGTKHIAPRGAVERAAGRQVRVEIRTARSAQRRLPHRPEMLKQTPHALSVRAVLVLLVSGRRAHVHDGARQPSR
jgi:hypothetical protein